MVQIGQKVTDFELDIFHEEQIKKVRLLSYKGKWVVLLFYPADMRAGYQIKPVE